MEEGLYEDDVVGLFVKEYEGGVWDVGDGWEDWFFGGKEDG